MIVSHSHRFVFIKTWKAAGSSIQAALAACCGPGDLVVDAGHPHPAFAKNLGHSTATEIRKFVGKEVWGRYYKFAFVRNPWDTYVSGYWWRTKARMEGAPFDSIREDFKSWLLRGEGRRNFSIIALNDTVDLDFVGRYETVSSDFEAISRRLGLQTALPSKDSPVSKGQYRLDGRPYQDYYDAETRDYVSRVEAPLARHFGYSFDSPAPSPR